MAFDPQIVPVVMFHSIGCERSGWSKAHLSEPLHLFERKIALLKSKGNRFVHWNELYEHMRGARPFREPAVMITFDDGYLDNYVYAFPVLQRYGAKATIFVNPEFVDPSSRARRAPADRAPLGFLNWEEMRVMEASGLVDIQSHALTHTWYFSDPHIVDFHHPWDDYPWLAWNHAPAYKHAYMTQDQRELVPFGSPIYAYDKALVCRRYFPDESLSAHLAYFVEQAGAGFFSRPNWKAELTAATAAYREANPLEDHTESLEEYRQRVLGELTLSKRLIEKNLSKEVDYICWPGGAYNDTVLELARQVGYKAWTLSSRDKGASRNRPGTDPTQIKRMGSHTYLRNRKGDPIGYAGARYFLRCVQRHRGSPWDKHLGRFLRATAMLKTLVPSLRKSP
jgi:peptidoglycan/xylan/chitin deacetylase (PgdA/CDA1 family)